MFGDEMIDEASHKMARAIVAKGRAPASPGRRRSRKDAETKSGELPHAVITRTVIIVTCRELPTR